MSEALEGLAALKKEDRPAFERLRKRLKEERCRVTALDEAIAEKSGDLGGRGPTQADILVDLAEPAELFHAPDGTGFADLRINGHRETWSIKSKGFRRWLTRRYYEERHGAPNAEALQAAINLIEAKAQFDGPERVVHVRVGGLDGRLYLDLCDDTWSAIEIDEDGWRVEVEPPLRFRRTAGMRPLPMPVRGGSIEDLRSFLNVHSDADFVLGVSWLLAAMRHSGPYPPLVLAGEQGSAKSTFSSILRKLVDPNTAPLRALSREDRELFIAANNAHVQVFDNVSRLAGWISDTLCRLATGGGFAVRQLYTDQDEILFDAARPVILNGIEDFVNRPDLADRSLFLTLELIPEEQRRSEQELWAEFEKVQPRISGVLLDAMVHGLRMLPYTRLDKLPRMADFAVWATACETAFWPTGTFMAAYCGNRDAAVEIVIDADAVAAAIRTMMVARAEWTGTASGLLELLGGIVGDKWQRPNDWPHSPQRLSGRLRRAAPCLRKVGINLEFVREGHNRIRTIYITTARENAATPPSAPSAPSAAAAPSDRLNQFKFSDETDADDADARTRVSAPENAMSRRL